MNEQDQKAALDHLEALVREWIHGWVRDDADLARCYAGGEAIWNDMESGLAIGEAIAFLNAQGRYLQGGIPVTFATKKSAEFNQGE